MPKFLRLTNKGGREVNINFCHIISFHNHDGNLTTLVVGNGGDGFPLEVKETPSQIMDMLGDSEVVAQHRKLLDEAFDRLQLQGDHSEP